MRLRIDPGHLRGTQGQGSGSLQVVLTQRNDSEINNGRNSINKNYNDTERAFADAHTPYYK